MFLGAQVLFYASILVRFFVGFFKTVITFFFPLKYTLLQRHSNFTWRLYIVSVTPLTRELANLNLLPSTTEMKENKIRF